jgi:hypothetical protein
MDRALLSPPGTAEAKMEALSSLLQGQLLDETAVKQIVYLSDTRTRRKGLLRLQRLDSVQDSGLNRETAVALRTPGEAIDRLRGFESGVIEMIQGFPEFLLDILSRHGC